MNLTRTRPSWLALIVLICIVTRLGIYLAFPSVFAFEKTGVIQGFDAYDIYATNLLKAGVYGLQPGVPDADFPPLYGYALALVYGLFGRGSLQVVVFHIVLDCLAIILLVQIGERLFPQSSAIALLAGLFYALYPYLVFQTLTVIDTPIFTLCTYIFILLMILLVERQGLDRRGLVLATFGGLVLGLTALDRPVIFALLIAVAAWFLVRVGFVQTLKRLVLVGVVSVAVLLPWNIRNYQVFHAVVNVATNAGMNFWFGNSQFTIPFFRAGFHTHWANPGTPPEPLDHLKNDSWMLSLAVKFLREHPEKIPELYWVKLLAYWSIDIFPRRNPIESAVAIPGTEDLVTVTTNAQGELEVAPKPGQDAVVAYSQPLFDQIGRAVHIAYFGGLFLLALAGIALSRRQWRSVSLLWFIQISMTVFYVIFSGPTTRYRVPTDPLLFLFSAYTLVWLWPYVRTRVSRIERHEPALAVSEK
jgi:4-amino-4-deoxy-L-arabinose transferase-like glycosyltransferase